MNQKQPPTLTEINQTIETYLRLKSRGDSLAELVKKDLEMRLTPSIKFEAEKLESVVDVAMRLGYTIKKNYDGALGAFVKRTCSDRIVGSQVTTAEVSGKRVATNMYLYKDPEVEKAVRCYCESQSFDNIHTKSFNELLDIPVNS